MPLIFINEFLYVLLLKYKIDTSIITLMEFIDNLYTKFELLK